MPKPASPRAAAAGADKHPDSDAKPLTYTLSDCFSDAIAKSFAATEHSKSNARAYAKSHALRRQGAVGSVRDH